MNKIWIKHPPGSGILHILKVGLRESDRDHEYVDASTLDQIGIAHVGGKADTVMVADFNVMTWQMQDALLHRLLEVGTDTVILLSTE